MVTVDRPFTLSGAEWSDAMFYRPIPHIKLVPTALEISEARFRRFLKDLEVYERRFAFERTMDAFLDLYSAWKKTHQPPVKLRLVMLAFELHRLDHAFECDLKFPEAEERREPHAPAPCEKSSSAT